MKPSSPLAFTLVLLLLLSPSRAQERGVGVARADSGRRVALVIGNGAYADAPLRNPVNDARDIARALGELGFDVIHRENLNQNDMKRAVREFGQRLRRGGTGLFYFAGHGVQVKGANYLVPVGAEVGSEEEVEYEAVDAGFVLAQMEAAGNGMNIVILDACRNNPFARSFRSGAKGLASMDAPSGTLIAYATAPGSVAGDGGGARNGIYTQELLKNLRTPGLSIEEVFKRVRISVRGLTQGKQTPWESSSLTGNFTFVAANAPEPPAPKAASNPRPATVNKKVEADTTRAFSLLEQKRYAEAAAEARRVAAAEPDNAEAWKISGMARLELKQYGEAASDLQRALDLQRAGGTTDPYTSDALIRAYMRAEQYERALPLLVDATGRRASLPDANLLYSRGVAEVKTNKPADAERSFAAALKADPRHAYSLYQLGYLAYNRKDLDSAVAYLNRATLADPKLTNAWTLLTYAYLKRAEAATGAKADADYLSAVRASETLIKLTDDDQTASLHAQALIRAKQYTRAAAVLERLAAKSDVDGTTLYLLGFAHSRARSFPKAADVLERAATKASGNVEIFRELGYVYEVLKEYAKALSTYERGLRVAPDDADLKQSAARVRPFAK